MNKFFCDLCRKEIRPSDIHVQIDMRVGDKYEHLDMYSSCHYEYLNELRRRLEDLDKE